MAEPFALQRFVDAQDAGATYARAMEELRAGRKRSHWMWFVFPQIAGLGRSPMARHFALTGRAEAQGYLAHPVLGPRLRACCAALLALPGSDAAAVLGELDALKLRSSLTLFEAAAPDEPLFAQVLDRWCGGQRDPVTAARLDRL